MLSTQVASSIYFNRITHVLEVKHIFKYFAEQAKFSYKSLIFLTQVSLQQLNQRLINYLFFFGGRLKLLW